MESFPNSSGQKIVLDLVKTVQSHAQYLSEVDGAIGDGDHGVNMSKGFTRAGELIAAGVTDFSEALASLGNVLLTEIGGAMGPLYGTFFLEMAGAAKGKPQTDKFLFGRMLEAGLEGVKDVGGAQVGDKTLLDTLSPACAAYKQAVERNESFVAALEQMSVAAEVGKESTRNLVARIGRASRLGERSRGVLDAGATSCALILQSLAKSITVVLTLQEVGPS